MLLVRKEVDCFNIFIKGLNTWIILIYSFRRYFSTKLTSIYLSIYLSYIQGVNKASVMDFTASYNDFGNIGRHQSRQVTCREGYSEIPALVFFEYSLKSFNKEEIK